MTAPAKIGRPAIKPPADAAEQITALAADGWSVLGIAHKLGVSHVTFKKWMDDADLKAALDQGREQERWTLHNKLFRAAMGNGKEANTAAMFLLKARHGYREQGPTDDSGPTTAIQIIIPGSMSREEYERLHGAPALPGIAKVERS